MGRVGLSPVPSPTNHPQHLAKRSTLGWARLQGAPLPSTPPQPGKELSLLVLPSGTWPQGGSRAPAGSRVQVRSPRKLEPWWSVRCTCAAGDTAFPAPAGRGGQERVCARTCIYVWTPVCTSCTCARVWTWVCVRIVCTRVCTSIHACIRVHGCMRGVRICRHVYVRRVCIGMCPHTGSRTCMCVC